MVDFCEFHKEEEDFWDIVYSIAGKDKTKNGKHDIVLINEIEQIYQVRNNKFYMYKSKLSKKLIKWKII